MVAVDISMATGATGMVSMPLFYQPLYSQQIISNISWGSAEQEVIPTVVDTGSYGFWVAGPNGTVNSGSPYLSVPGPCNETIEPFFNYPESGSATQPVPNSEVTFAYGGGGKIIHCPHAINDTMNFEGDYEPIRNIQVALADYIHIKDRATTCNGAHYDRSIMGLAPIPAIGSANAPEIHRDLTAQGRLRNHVFSMWFDAPQEDIHKPQMGTLVWGDEPEDKHTGSLVTIRNQGQDRVEKGYYYAVMPEVRGDLNASVIPLADQESPAPDCLVDSGTWGVTIPTSDDAFFAATGLEADEPFLNPRYPSSCEDIPLDAGFNMTFTDITDKGKTATVRIPFRSLAMGVGLEPKTCRLNVQLADIHCTLGGTFYASAFIVHDDEKQIMKIAQGAKLGSA